MGNLAVILRVGIIPAHDPDRLSEAPDVDEAHIKREDDGAADQPRDDEREIVRGAGRAHKVDAVEDDRGQPIGNRRDHVIDALVERRSGRFLGQRTRCACNQNPECSDQPRPHGLSRLP